jgi:aspartate/methionine/tyrosine aminotransferase
MAKTVEDLKYGRGDAAPVIAAAMTVVGPGEGKAWERDIAAAAIDVATLCVGDVGRVAAAMLNGRVFTAVIEAIEKEESTTRGLVTLRSDVNARYGRKSGKEQIRTERTDANTGGKELANHIAKNLIGHKAVLFVGAEPIANTDELGRVLLKVIDLGLAEEEG